MLNFSINFFTVTPRKINACLFGTDDSEIEDFNDEENEDNVLSASTREQSLFQANWSDNTDSDLDYHPSTSDSDNEPTTSTAVKKNQLAKRKKNTKLQPPIKRTKNIPTAEPWRKGIFSPDPVTLHEPSYIPLDCTNWSNEKFVELYYDDDILLQFVEKSNQTYVLKTGNSLNLSLREFKVWLGVNFVMSSLQLPQIRMYWDKEWRVAVVADHMSRDRFFQIRNSLKIVFDDDINEEQRKADRLWKIRPLIDRVLLGCLKQTRNQHICIDEMMIPFSGTSDLKQYIPNKPNPLGIKVFVLANPTGIICDFVVYQNQTTFTQDIAGSFWQCESAVLYLTRSLVPGHVIYIDRYFNTVRLAEELLSRGIRCSGTLRKDRLPQDNDLPDDKIFKKSQSRGSATVSVRADGAIALTKWLDNKSVTMISTNESVEPMCEVKRWSKAEKRYIQVSQPSVVQSYNKNMGGVDLIDRILSYCPSRSRTKKWTVRCLLHFFDVALGNAWLQMREIKKSSGVSPKDIVQFRHFKLELGKSMIEKNSVRLDVDENGDEDQGHQEEGFLDRRKSAGPCLEKRLQGATHLPEVTKKIQKRCALPKCLKKSTVFCTQCKVYLCLVDGRNCFAKYHTK
ncbi:piggyBac transposable element-derived protein 3-like [Homalodisca vitripennis]|uniref:piggyBac transposable element-derived protein 3-like n=1 Tax=Homalodisca vitripennis TaxID=197043 RepID=UPI001EEAD699|nr:piggyBac transposable element-derived protein 3-like [Homalodisca vitripennis]